MEHCCVLTSLERMKKAGSDGFHRVIPAQGGNLGDSRSQAWMLLQHTTHLARHGEVLPDIWEVGAQALVRLSLERRSMDRDPLTGPPQGYFSKLTKAEVDWSAGPSAC